MAEFTADFHTSVDPRFFDHSMSFQTHFSLSDDMFCTYPRISDQIFPENNQIPRPIDETRKRKAAIDELQTSSTISTPQASENGIKRKKGSGRGGKREKSEEREGEKGGEIVVVRARRGQATDRHSLAERVRRGKINERLRCLRDIVPGCYKSKGMAVMLDEIINYVQSLQNQVEFLSSRLAAANNFNDCNFDPHYVMRLEVAETKESEKLMIEGCGTLACFQSSWPF